MSEETKKIDMELVRTNNGEWISDEYAFFPSKFNERIRLSSAKRLGLPLERHIISDGSVWFYRFQLDDLRNAESGDDLFDRIVKASVSRMISRKDVWERLLNPDDEVRNIIRTADEQGYLVHIRHNYLNIYYLGVSMLKISFKRDASPQYYVDDGYFKHSDVQKDSLMASLKEDPAAYFRDMKKVMDEWSKQSRHKHKEKQTQQNINLANRKPTDSDFTVVDLEYAYAVGSNKYGGAPRFDIVAIDNNTHQLVVFELKDGNGATGGTSGVKPHIDNFNKTFAGEKRKDFKHEMALMVKQMKELDLLDKDVCVDEEREVKFMFIYRGNSEEREIFETSYGTEMQKYQCIYLNGDDDAIESYKLRRA